MPDFDPHSRPSWDEWGLGIAAAVATRGECTRRRIGAVIINRRTRQIFAGYNGAPPGEPSCLSGACPRGLHYAVPMWEGDDSPGMCFTCEVEWPCSKAVAHDSSYDTGPGACTATHAELGALMDAGRANLTDDCVMYVSDKPCPACERIIRGVLKRVVWPGGELMFD